MLRCRFDFVRGKVLGKEAQTLALLSKGHGYSNFVNKKSPGTARFREGACRGCPEALERQRNNAFTTSTSRRRSIAPTIPRFAFQGLGAGSGRFACTPELQLKPLSTPMQ